MKKNMLYPGLSMRFIFILLLLSYSLYSSAQRNVTTIHLNGEMIKKKPIIDSLSEWMSRKDLRKADSCIQIIFNAIHLKDTAAEMSGIDGLMKIVSSKKYEDELSIPGYEGKRFLPGSLSYCDLCRSLLCRIICIPKKKNATLSKEL